MNRIFSLLLLGMMSFGMSTALAAKKTMLNVNVNNISAALKGLKDKKVSLLLHGGGNVSGGISDASASWVHLIPTTPQEGQEVLISTSAIAGVIYHAGPND
ncbi:MAG: hypothetical protein SGJ18_08560 [Pseudomonadota bacterium]|nr:hypothetical protein [Pseudomonadota bacterium]